MDAARNLSKEGRQFSRVVVGGQPENVLTQLLLSRIGLYLMTYSVQDTGIILKNIFNFGTNIQ
jgi:hypothetical protein